jgi:hypothetical protein
MPSWEKSQTRVTLEALIGEAADARDTNLEDRLTGILEDVKKLEAKVARHRDAAATRASIIRAEQERAGVILGELLADVTDASVARLADVEHHTELAREKILALTQLLGDLPT